MDINLHTVSLHPEEVFLCDSQQINNINKTKNKVQKGSQDIQLQLLCTTS